ncbi:MULTISPECIES: 2-hydroxyacid dehydrogenase [Cupriavidus]|uniref:Glyoxylate/hydroxypyruvate reductase A n=1 Tax=Cupriavidus pauculus TaxID=82633 RepID=A0A5P2H9H0_9BURK|nr:glyoxylate/hydroxypyruvate reductase A [Cupriavidus pauculus]QET04113.1 glyoxylate/hydroxypyruvate reductase A [Cupriavidus pauculus]
MTLAPTRIAFISQSASLDYFGPLMADALPHAEVSVWPDPRCLEADIAVCWIPPPGIYARMPRLRLIHGIAAGVDNILEGQDTRGLPVCRVVEPGLTQGMVEYVRWSVLYFHRDFDHMAMQQRERVWKRLPLRPAADCRVGVMGLGELGGVVARTLRDDGYDVGGWSRSPREIDGVATWHGDEGLPAFLARTDVLICLLPLTDATRGILGARTFAQLPRGAAIVHCGRGEHLAVDALTDALSTGHLRGAVLDVFPVEPLPEDSPLWRCPGVVVTPHMASMASSAEIVRQVAANVARLGSGEPLRNTVDLARGY